MGHLISEPKFKIPTPAPPLLISDKSLKAQHKSFSSNAETLTEAVQCTDDQEGAHTVEQAGHSWYGAGTFLGGKIEIIKRPFNSRVLPVAFRHVTSN